MSTMVVLCMKKSRHKTCNTRHRDQRGTIAPLWPHKTDMDDFCSGFASIPHLLFYQAIILGWKNKDFSVKLLAKEQSFMNCSTKDNERRAVKIRTVAVFIENSLLGNTHKKSWLNSFSSPQLSSFHLFLLFSFDHVIWGLFLTLFDNRNKSLASNDSLSVIRASYAPVGLTVK